MAAVFGVERETVVWTGRMEEAFSAQGDVRRQHCAACGSPLTYQSVEWPEETHLYAATLDDPSRFRPEAHYHWAERVPWLTIEDDLPKYPGSADTTEPV